MSGFSTRWLQLRGPADAAARDQALLQRLVEQADGAPQRIIDLGCGLGASVAALAPRLGQEQRWLLVDHDPALLAAVPEHLSRWAAGLGAQAARRPGRLVLRGRAWSARVETAELDLAGPDWPAALDGASLVTGSALLDLVSRPWLERLVETAGARTSFWFPLNADGRIAMDPVDAADGLVLGLFARHHQSDKGFGPALGAGATNLAADLFRAVGRQALVGDSPWRLGPPDGDLLVALLQGHAAAAAALATAAEEVEVAAWLDRRLAAVAEGRLRVLIGHQDLLIPAARGAG